jgi:uncharacterized protein YaaN involved in tellurite resistance
MSDSLNIDRALGPSVAPSSAAASASGTAAEKEALAPTGAAPAAGEGNSLALVPPEPVKIVEPTVALDSLKLDQATVVKLDGMVAGYIAAVATFDVKDPKFEARVTDIRKLGDDEINASSQVSSRLLSRPVSSLQKSGLSGTSGVAASLLQLRRQVDALDPGRQGELFGPHKLLGILPFGDRLTRYFAKYQSSQGHINSIIGALRNGQDNLQRDNVDLEQEKANLWQIMEKLRQYIYLAQKLDAALAARIAQVQANDPERARILSEDMLFYVRQKSQDLTTQLAVSVQGYMALDVIRRNNLELIRGVDRATTTTISALRTAVIVAQALSDQKLVLDQITALNTTTSDLIESTSVLLRQQSAAINEQAASSTIDLQKLQLAFDNIYATMDEIDAYKLKALDSMNKTVDSLNGQIRKAQSFLERARSREQSDQDKTELTLPK